VVLLFVLAAESGGLAVSTAQTASSLTNDDVINLKRAGVGDEVILLKIQSGPTNFKTGAPDLVALKEAGVSDPVIAAMLKSPASNTTTPTAPLGNNVRPTKPADGLLKTAVI